jgi:hypothetical protein
MTDTRKVDVNRAAPAKPRLGAFEGSDHLRRMGQVEWTGRDEACVMPMCLGSDGDAHQAGHVSKVMMG